MILYNLDLVRKQISAHGYDINTIGRYRLAKCLCIGEKAARTILNQLKSDNRQKPQSETPWVNEVPKAPVKTETVSVSKDGATYELPSTRIHTLEQLIAHFEVDTDLYEIERFVANKWEVGAKDADGKIVVEPLYQVKAIFKRKNPTIVSVKDQWEYIKSTLEDKSIPNPKYYYNISSPVLDEYLVEINMPDSHFGQLSSAAETGDKNWDVKIAKKTYLETYYGLMNKVLKVCSPDKILQVIGNDLCNVESNANTTERGTRQDQDGRYFKMFQGAWDSVYETVEHARQIAPVDVCVMPGNHDRITSWSLGFALDCAMKNRPNVNVDIRPLLRKYYEYGVNMLMFTHGDTLKHKDIPLLMMREQPQMAARTNFHEAHIGHIHQEKVIEMAGVKVRVVPSLAPASYWAASNGWTTGKRGAQAFIYHKHDGLVWIVNQFIE